MSERRYPSEPRAPAILAVDVGGSNVKAVLNGVDERRRFPSGDALTAEQMVSGVLDLSETGTTLVSRPSRHLWSTAELSVIL